jgi:asparagine synthase (glutamine-hydrolysing)
MCGICGFAGRQGNPESNRALLLAMATRIAHRGPDDAGYFLTLDGSAGLGHRRLSIIDISGGHQPMTNEDGTVQIVFNGEIYNFQELKKNLESAGHKFATHCDTETILHLYEEKGPACVQELRGMFAFAIWDSRRERLFMARDRLGVKPLYYRHSGGTLTFASEIKSILADSAVPRRLNPVALDRYLTYAYVPHPLTMFDGIAKLSPGHWAIWEDGRLTVERYWLPDFDREVPGSEAEYIERVRTMLDEATRIRLMSEVPLGAFLSGGIDSSITVALMALATSSPVKTFSIRFREKEYNETDYARLVAERYKTDHTEFIVEPKGLEVLADLAWFYDEPFADSSAIPTYYVSKMAAQKVTVALSGDAGDEDFAGYSWRYRAVRLASIYDRMPGLFKAFFSPRMWRHLPTSVKQKSMRRAAKKLVLTLGLPPEERYLTWIAINEEARKLALYSEAFARTLEGSGRAVDFIVNEHRRSPHRDPVSRGTFVDLMTYLPCDILTKVDIASMAHSLEVRSPFLDHKVIEMAIGMPVDLKMRGLTCKYILRKAFDDVVPREIIDRPKKGFGVPIDQWFMTELQGFLKNVLLDERTHARGYFLPEAVATLIDEHVNHVFNHCHRLWALLMLELWHRTYIDAAGDHSIKGLEELL